MGYEYEIYDNCKDFTMIVICIHREQNFHAYN